MVYFYFNSWDHLSLVYSLPPRFLVTWFYVKSVIEFNSWEWEVIIHTEYLKCLYYLSMHLTSNELTILFSISIFFKNYKLFNERIIT